MKPRPYILAENNWKTIKSSSFDVAVLPWGATEAHNYHLPYGTDIVEAEEIAAESARLAWEKGAKVIVLPAIPFGVNTGQHDILLDMNMNPSTQLTVLRDVVQVLSRQGIHKLVILNSHGGNDFKPMIRELGLQFNLCLYAVATGLGQSIKSFFLKTGMITQEKWNQVSCCICVRIGLTLKRRVMALLKNSGSRR